jgi:hypothetical protein
MKVYDPNTGEMIQSEHPVVCSQRDSCPHLACIARTPHVPMTIEFSEENAGSDCTSCSCGCEYNATCVPLSGMTQR